MSKTSQHPFLQLLEYAQAHKQTIGRGVIASVVNKIFDLAPPVLIGVAVDVVVSKQDSFLGYLGITSVTTQLWVLAGITLLIWSCESLFDYIADLIWRNLAQTLQHELRVATFANLQSLELGYFEDATSGNLMAVLNDDVNQLERFLDSGAHDIIILCTTIVVVGALFVCIVPSIAWMALLPMPIVGLGSLLFQKKIAPRYRAVREQAGLINAQLANSIGGIATVKSFSAESHERARVEALSQEYCVRNRSAIRISAAFVPLIRIVIVVGFAAIMIYAGEKVVAGSLNVGLYSILVFMTQRLLWPLTTLGTTMDLYQRSMASTARIFDVLHTPSKILDGSDTAAAISKGAVSFEQVAFSYRSGEPILEGVSFQITAGSSVGIVGSTGSGKTTLVKLLLRFYDPQSGTITIDGHAIETLPLKTLRDAIAFVSQDIFLVDGSIRENISYGSFTASTVAIEAAAQVAEVHDFIMSLPDGYDTLVGERGQKLSGGQRQRIAIARAVLKDAPIIVLDEATSSVDNETEAVIQRALERIAQKKTLIVIAHRLSTVRNTDTIYVFDRGSIAESGTHEELLNQNGIYASLWAVQTGSLPGGTS